MSKAAEYLLELDKADFRVLQSIEVGMRTSEYVSIETVAEFSKLTLDEIIKRIDGLHFKDLVFRWKGHYTGYHLTHHGYDVLAFKALSERDSIIAIGRELGKGKESDVFFAFDVKQKIVVAKIHRVGRPSFQRSKKLRSYVGRRGHINWLYKSRLSAEREFQGLKLARKIKAKVPNPIDQNRHIIVMDFFDGIELVDAYDLKKPLKVFNGIMNQVRKLFVKGNIVHGDLSEYNIIITPKNNFLIIDFPQYELASHPNAKEYLFRDIKNLCKFFERKFSIESNPDEILDVIYSEYEEKLLKKKKKKK
ncbi:MAG: RIO1 family regulatory kinase/ATPase domain-containing protein [Candidatus Heimdallarchaeota archaeon]